MHTTQYVATESTRIPRNNKMYSTLQNVINTNTLQHHSRHTCTPHTPSKISVGSGGAHVLEAVDADADKPLNSWYNRGHGHLQSSARGDWTPLFELECVRLALTLSNMNDFGECCRTAARMLCPDRDASSWEFPCPEKLRQNIIRLDM